MNRTVAASCVMVLAVGLLSATRPAGAATISSIHYDISDGMFGGVLFDGYFGPITGVSVTYTPPGGSVSTPFVCIGSASCGRLDFVFTGPSLTPSASTMLYIDLSTVYLDSAYFGASRAIPVSGLGTVWWVLGASFGEGAGHTGLMSYATSLATIYTVGNEVRVMPEPSSHAALAFGIALLLALASARARRSARPL